MAVLQERQAKIGPIGRCRALQAVVIVWFLLAGAFPMSSSGVPMAFAQTVPATADSFNAPDGETLNDRIPSVGAAFFPWQVSATGSGSPGTPVLVGGRAKLGADATANWVASLVGTPDSDAIVGVDYHVGASGLPWGGVIVRASDADNYLLGLAANNSLYLYRLQAGAWTTLASATGVAAEPGSVHRLEVRAIGSMIEVWWDGRRRLQATETFQRTASQFGIGWAPALRPGHHVRQLRSEATVGVRRLRRTRRYRVDESCV